LDSSFNGTGQVLTDFFNSSSDLANAVSLDSAGRIVAAGGTSALGNGSDFALTRYNADGSLDTTFGSNGKVATHFGPGNAVANAVVIDRFGRIVAIGRRKVVNGDWALARYTADGSLDTTSGTNGIVTTDSSGTGSSEEEAGGVAIDRAE